MPKLKPLRLVVAGVDKISAPINRINRKIQTLTRPINTVRNRLIALDRASGFKRLRGAVGNVATQLGALTRRAALLGGVVAFAAGRAITSFIGLGDQVAKTAAAIGISSEALQEWRFAADRMGVSSDVTDKSLIRMGRTLGELKLGTGALYTILKKNAPALLEQFKATQTTEEGLALLTKTMSELENQGVKLALAQAALGRGGTLMAKLLTAGSDEIEKLRQRARDLGLVMSDETAAAAEDAQDQLTNLRAVVKGIAYAIGGGLLPEITSLLKQLLAWREANRELIQVKVVETVNALVAGLRSTVQFFRVAIPIVRNVVSALGGFKTIAAALAVLIVGKLVVALATLSATLLATPIGWVILGIAAIAAGAALIVKNWEPLKAWFADLFGSIGDKLRRFESMVPGFIRKGLGIVGEPAGAPAGARGGAPLRRGGAAAAVAGARGSFDGALDVRISQDRPPRIAEILQQGDIEMSVETGLTLAPQGV